MRYRNRFRIRNSEKIYEQILTSKGIPFIDHYSTPHVFYPNPKTMKSMSIANHVWSLGDRFYKLSHSFYGSPKFWWVIAWFNNTPTESHVNLGDIIFIPTGLSEAIRIYDGT